MDEKNEQRVKYKIKCPFCFKEFNHDQVHFRISKQIEALNEESSEYEYFQPVSTDEKLMRHWKMAGEGSIPKKMQETEQLPVVTPENKKHMTKSGYIKNEQDFVEKIIDIYDNVSYNRICPHCHSMLPNNYGMHEQKMISVLGVTSSGKTVYIRQLLSQIKEFLAKINANYVYGAGLDRGDAEIVKHGTILPSATITTDFKEPYFITIRLNDIYDKNNKKLRDSETYDFVFYDIAGENLIIDIADPERIRKINFYAEFIKKSDGIIYLVEPNQFIENVNFKNKYDPDEIITTLNQQFNVVRDKKIETPTAFVMSKFDLFEIDGDIKNELLDSNSKYFQNNEGFSELVWDPKNKYFYADKHSYINTVMKKFYDERAAYFSTSVKNNFKNAAYFAVSALADSVENRLVFTIEPKRDCNINDLKNLSQQFNFLNPLVENVHTDENNHLKESNYSIVLDIDTFKRLNIILSMINDNKNILDEYYQDSDEIRLDRISIKKKQFSELLDFWLNHDYSKYKFDMHIEGYPNPNGNLKSYRIEEPLFWLFYKMGLIISNKEYDVEEELTFFRRLKNKLIGQ